MEFRFRAGDGGPFSCSALETGGYSTGGGDFRRPNSLPSGPFPWLSAREALMRELEKERIRGEIIAREICWRRELEEEVRRELALEREFAFRRYGDRFSSLLPSSSLQSERGFGERFLHSAYRAFERHPFERLPAEHRPQSASAEIKPTHELEKAQAKFSPSLVSGTKRQLETPGNELAWLSSVSKVKKEWSCALCQVSVTNKETLDEHLKGRKHKAKETQLKGSKSEGGNKRSVASTAEEAEKSSPSDDQTTVVPDDSASKKAEEEEQKIDYTGAGTGKKRKRGKQETKGGEREKFVIVCELCNIKCYSKKVIEEHYKGKRHMALTLKRERNSAAVMKSPTSPQCKEATNVVVKEGDNTDQTVGEVNENGEKPVSANTVNEKEENNWPEVRPDELATSPAKDSMVEEHCS